ncbi:hypothetical protein ISS40_01245 [Candidatus Bathyarchaeota archaeon]|nr:hypothetical protein [Candidatus Bathyarchaeota archaeon]
MSQEETEIVWVKCELEGKPARIVKELKRRGIVKSVREAVVQGLLTYWDQVMVRDLREAQARTGTRIAAKASQ